ncbi:MAG TPA: winged helix DNA-binding domain-containing protein [Acidimicrobiales bacterium]
MSADVLGDRALNRATLHRQLLLRRTDRPVLDVVERLVGLQAQEPPDPYLALWSRLDGFEPDDLGRLLVDRKVVRIVAMRGTIHLLTADDCLALRPVMQPVLDGELRRHRDYAPRLEGVDLAPVLAAARELVADTPLSGKELRAALAERFPDHDAAALAYACRCLLPMVQVPPRGLWGQSAQVRTTTAESWLGRPLAPAAIDDIVLRYLAAFGPATPADVATWCRLTGMREVIDRLRPRLRTFRDERGRELVDLPDAPRPDPEVPAPTRFLPEYDNVLLSHADRSRVLDKDEADRLYANRGHAVGSVLHDGRLVATWRLHRDPDRGAATLVVRHLPRLPGPAAADVVAEGAQVLGLLAADATERDVRLEPVE